MKLDGYYKHRKGFLFEAIKCQTFYVPNDTPNAVLYHKTMVDTTKQQNHFQTAVKRIMGQKVGYAMFLSMALYCGQKHRTPKFSPIIAIAF